MNVLPRTLAPMFRLTAENLDFVINYEAWGRRIAAHPRWLAGVDPNPNGVPHWHVRGRHARAMRALWNPVGVRAVFGTLTWGAPLPRRPKALMCDPVGVNHNGADSGSES